MAFLLTHFWPGGTEEQYRATLAVAHPDGLPEGQIYHVAAEADEGILIAAVWESEEACNRFLETLMSKDAVEGGLVGPPVAGGGEVVNLVTA